MIITPLDRLFYWFSEIWHKINAMKTIQDKYSLRIYILGVVSLALQLPCVYLISYVLGINILDISHFQNIRIYLAISLWAICMYFIGGAVAIRQYRKIKSDGKKE